MKEKNDKNIELIDKHLSGTLSEEEAILFDERMRQADFKTLIIEMKHVKSGIATFELRQIKSILQEEELQIQLKNKKGNPPKKTIGISQKILLIAAILAGLSFGIWWISSQINNNATNQTDYFAQYFSPATNVLTKNNRSLAHSNPVKQTFAHYDNKQYEDFLNEIEALIAQDGNDDYKFYQANALLETGQADAAIIILNQILQKKKSQFTEDAKWLLSLAYLRKEQWKEARQILESISLPSHKSKAEIILRELD